MPRCDEAQLYMTLPLSLHFTSLLFLPLPMPPRITSRERKKRGEEILCTFASMIAHVMLCVLRR